MVIEVMSEKALLRPSKTNEVVGLFETTENTSFSYSRYYLILRPHVCVWSLVNKTDGCDVLLNNLSESPIDV